MSKVKEVPAFDFYREVINDPIRWDGMSDQGKGQIIWFLGQCYQKGIDTPKDIGKALELYLEAWNKYKYKRGKDEILNLIK